MKPILKTLLVVSSAALAYTGTAVAEFQNVFRLTFTTEEGDPVGTAVFRFDTPTRFGTFVIGELENATYALDIIYPGVEFNGFVNHRLSGEGETITISGNDIENRQISFNDPTGSNTSFSIIGYRLGHVDGDHLFDIADSRGNPSSPERLDDLRWTVTDLSGLTFPELEIEKNVFLLRFNSVQDETYTLQRSSNLVDWVDYMTDIEGDGSIKKFFVEVSVPKYFYRLIPAE